MIRILPVQLPGNWQTARSKAANQGELLMNRTGGFEVLACSRIVEPITFNAGVPESTVGFGCRTTDPFRVSYSFRVHFLIALIIIPSIAFAGPEIGAEVEVVPTQR